MDFKKTITIILCILSLVIFTAAKKQAKPPKAPKPTVASVIKELKTANATISELQAQKVSLTARVTALETDLKKFKKDSDAKFLATAASGGGGLLIAIAVIILLVSKNSAQAGANKDKSGKLTREDHFADIEYHVLDDWHNIWFHPDRIDKKLYEDLKNHFEELYNKIEEWKGDIKKREELTEHLSKAMGEKFDDIEATPSIHLLVSEDANTFVDENEIMSGTFICAHMRPGFEGTQDRMKKYYETALKLFDEKPYAEVKKLNNDISFMKNEIDVKIRKIKYARNLPGDCGYLNSQE